MYILLTNVFLYFYFLRSVQFVKIAKINTEKQIIRMINKCIFYVSMSRFLIRFALHAVLREGKTREEEEQRDGEMGRGGRVSEEEKGIKGDGSGDVDGEENIKGGEEKENKYMKILNKEVHTQETREN